MRRIGVALVAALLGLATPIFAQTGPVATVCAKDIQKYCATQGHGDRQTRSCLESNRKKLSAACRRALDTTGGGRG